MKPHNPLYYRWKGKLLHSGIHILSHMRLLIRSFPFSPAALWDSSAWHLSTVFSL